MNHRAVLAFCREKEVKAIDLRYIDPCGVWRSKVIPVERLTEAAFEQGFLVTESMLPGQPCLDRLLIPIAETAVLDPYAAVSTLIVIGNLQDPVTRESDPFDSRSIADQAIRFLASSGIAETALVATRMEFFVFEKLEVNRTAQSAYWNITPQQSDQSAFAFRNSILDQLRESEIPAVAHLQPHGSIKQSLAFDPLPINSAADALVLGKHLIKQYAAQQNKVACFLPQPMAGTTGAGLSVHLSLVRGSESLFAGQSFGGLSELGMRALAGILRHAAALSALCNPTTNSFKRLFSTGSPEWFVGYSQHRSNAACRIPRVGNFPQRRGVEFCLPDPSANPYLAFAAILMAAVDGIQNKLEPGPVDTSFKSNGNSLSVPLSLWDALDELEADIEFLAQGDVFNQDSLLQWIDMKRTYERARVESEPTPAEFAYYADL